MTSSRPGPLPELSGVVIHWRNEEQLRRLLEAWPQDERFELVIVDNSQTLRDLPPWVQRFDVHLVDPGRNLGFAGGVNRGASQARAAILLLLNPDVVPRPGALDALLEGFERFPEVAGLAPRLWQTQPSGQEGRTLQFRWQLRPLPNPWTLILQTLLIPAGQGPQAEPEAGALIAQPAAAALALKRDVLRDLGGFDEGFFPAWFEDVDFARRLSARGLSFRYWPAAEFFHELGASLPGLGYGPFLWIYYRNLLRFLGKHHGAGWSRLASLTLMLGMGLRLVLLPLVKPRRARSRGEAARGLAAVLAGVLTGWRFPRSWARRFTAIPEGT